ncbi:hypothetical protein BBAD15_g9189 [Beauveria bassiana D1-5]|uniref:Flavin reductase like domain-containing protein n=1 Tax=Beauveria bassiana D1-5 TaxID=1245745 RepID=A0A0A2VCG3_BEABA|nr:hypothetical protein BBAD15_g9189 [Beauveria bassiana D1-5]
MAPQNFLSAATGIDKHRRRDFGASSAHEVCIHTSAHCNTRADLVIACSVLHCHISVLLLFVAYRPQYRSWIPQWASLANEGSLNNAAFGALFLPHSHITAARRCIEVSKTAVLQAIWRDAGGETGAGRSWRRNWLLRRSDGASALHDTTKGVRAGTTDNVSSRGFRPSASHASSWHVAPPSPPTTDLKAPKPPPEQLRAVMRLLSQSVVVCTSAGHDKIPRAMTMSSFTSLTLKPTPVITFNVATPSRTLDSIQASRSFNIHVLSGDSSGAAVADHFTRGNEGADVFAGLEDVVLEQSAEDSTALAPPPPLLRGKGVVHVLRCRLLEDEPVRGLIRVRDHMIVVAEVVEMIPGVESNEFGLAYADRKYRQVGSVISNE